MKRTIASLVVAALLLSIVTVGLVRAGPEPVTLGDEGWSVAEVGTWDPDTRTATLTTDLSRGIRIIGDNLVLEGNGQTLTGDNTVPGVYLEYRTGVEVRNLTVQGFAYGIHLRSGSGNTVTGVNALSNRFHGIFVESSQGDTLSGNRADGNVNDGIYLSGAGGNTLSGNTANGNKRYGLNLDGAGGSSLSGNTMADNKWNFRLVGTWDGDYDNTADTSNLVGGKPIYYLKGVTGGTIDGGSNAGAVYLVSCSDVVVRDVTLEKNHVGLLLWKTHNSRLENIQAASNSTGIWLRHSTGNTLLGSTVSANVYGVHLEGGGGNTVKRNTISGNQLYGVYVNSESSNNRVYNNNFLSNPTQASISGATGNVFNLDRPEGGNHWSDWTKPDADGDGIVDSAYASNGVQDNLPWANRDGWLAYTPPPPPPPPEPAPEPTPEPPPPPPSPNVGKVTGGGWMNVPEGKANLGLVCMYRDGGSAPQGQTEFQAPGLKFHSQSYSWLRVEGSRAWYEGSGVLNGRGGYGFLVSLVDGKASGGPSLARVKIWDSAGNVVFDSQPGADHSAAPTTELRGGNIVVHQK